MHLSQLLPAVWVAGSVSLASVAQAQVVVVEPHWVGLSLGVASVKAKSSDLDTAENYKFELGRWFNQNFALEMGASAARNAKENGEDNRGAYSLKLESNDAFIGPRISTNHYDPLRFFASGGLLYSRVTVEVEESFYGIKPGGKASDENSVFGYYLNGGVAFATQSKIDLSAALCYRHRPGVIKTYNGDVDVNDVALNVGAEFRF